MIKYIKGSLKRKIARRFTKEYSYTVSSYPLSKDAAVEVANWDNPLVGKIDLRQPTVDFYSKFIKKGDLAIDIGANVGDTTLPMGLAAGKEGLVLAFDPNPVVFKILEKNASLNRERSNIVPLNFAISVQEEEFYFISSEASFANGAISPSRESRHGKFVYPQKIKGINLEQLLESNYSEWINKLAFIKVDTEGYDKEILKSISALIGKCKPVILAESMGENTNEEKMELYDVIDRHGYETYYFEDFDTGAATKRLTNRKQMTDWKDTMNLYAIPINKA